MSIPYGTLRDIANELKNIRETLEKQQSIEVSEDAISREWLFKNYQAVCENVICSECPFDNDDCRLADFIINAPSVVPKEKEGRNDEKNEACEKGYINGVEDCKAHFREQCKQCQMESEKAFHEGHLLGKNEDEMDKVFGGIEAIKPKGNDDK